MSLLRLQRETIFSINSVVLASAMSGKAFVNKGLMSSRELRVDVRAHWKWSSGAREILNHAGALDLLRQGYALQTYFSAPAFEPSLRGRARFGWHFLPAVAG